jgi:hypothetical protein
MVSMLPPPPPVAALRALGVRPSETFTVPAHQAVWRVHRTTGPHLLAWNQLRTFGPVLRFDHHPRPRSMHSDYSIWYGSDTPRGALAEAFQSTRVIDTGIGAPFLTGMQFSRPLTLLDVSGITGGTWMTRVGGNHALDSAPHSRSQQRARAIHRAHSHLDGIAYRGRFAGNTCFALFERAADAFPVSPAMSHPLTHPGLTVRIAASAADLGYSFV